MSNIREKLVKLLQDAPNSPVIGKLVSEVEENYPADLDRDSELLYGVWDLRWSSSSQLWLSQAPWLENLQILDPVEKEVATYSVFGALLSLQEVLLYRQT